MNKRKLALLAALPAAVLLANNAVAGADVYGKVNVSLQHEHADDGTNDTQDTWALESNASRFGIKTSTDLGDTGLKGVAKIEYEAYVDDGSNTTTTTGTDSNGDTFSYSYDSQIGQRNIYAGVQGGFGTVIAGKFDTPMKESQGKVDLFNDYILGDIKSVLTRGEDRMSNIIMYSTPKLESGLAFNFAVMPGEESDVTGGKDLNGDGHTTNDGIADAMSGSVTYDSENLYLAFAANENVTNTNMMRLTGQLKMDAFTVGAILQKGKVKEDDANDDGIQDLFFDQKGYVLSASYTMGNHVIKAEYGHSSNKDDLDNNDVKVKDLSLGYDYKLGKDAMVYAYVSDYSSKEGTAEVNKDTMGVGYELKF